MKTRRTSWIYILTCVTLFFQGCGKEDEDIVSLPVVVTGGIDAITQESVSATGEVIATGGGEVTERGVCWNNVEVPTIADNKIVNGNGEGEFIVEVDKLNPETKYFLRAYAINSAGVSYGESVSFTTLPLEIPVITTTEASSVTTNSVISGGVITSDGGGNITASGICWSVNPNPTVDNEKLINSIDSDSFESKITDLSPNTKYYLRSFATNEIGTGYGNEVAFVTLNALPVISSPVVTSITTSEATIQSNISGSGILKRGVCFSTSPNPSFNDMFRFDPSIEGAFLMILNNLEPNSQYYARVFAMNSADTTYSEEVNFATQAGVPTVQTRAIAAIRANEASAGGYVYSSGGLEVTEFGVCYSTSSNPTIGDNKVIMGSGTGDFYDKVTGLVVNTTYYLRAYAKNSLGVGYGQVVSFTTTYVLRDIGPAGGFIFYDKGSYSDGWRYMEAAPESTEWTDKPWGCYGTIIGGTSVAIGAGASNTEAIVAGCADTGTAARLCDELVVDGYDDWFLPSKGEYAEMVYELYHYDVGGLSSGFYWSSSEYNGVYAYATGNYKNKKYLYPVRAARRF